VYVCVNDVVYPWRLGTQWRRRPCYSGELSRHWRLHQCTRTVADVDHQHRYIKLLQLICLSSTICI